MVLSQEEIDGCREAFLAFDKDRSGTIDIYELRDVLEAMGQQPTEEELFQLLNSVDEDGTGEIDFAEFLKGVSLCITLICIGQQIFFNKKCLLLVIEHQKTRAEDADDEGDMLDAFVACGGDSDKGGHVKRETLVRIIKQDFGLPIVS